MSFNLPQLHEALLAATGRAVSEGDAALAYVRIDQAALRAAQSHRVRWERWDGESMVGAARPIDITARMDYDGGEIYLVYIDDQLVYLQPHSPEGGPIRLEDLEEVASRHVATIVDDIVFAEALEIAVSLLPVPAPVEPGVGPTTPVRPMLRPRDA